MASYVQLLSNIQENTPVLLEDLEKVCSFAHVIISAEDSLKSKRELHEVLASYMQQITTSPVIALLDCESVLVQVEGDDDRKLPDCDFSAMMEHFRDTQSSQVHVMHKAYTHVPMYSETCLGQPPVGQF